MNAKGCLFLLAVCGVLFAFTGLRMCSSELGEYADSQHEREQTKRKAQAVLNEANQYFARAMSFYESQLFDKATSEFRTAYETLESGGNLNATNYEHLQAAIISAICSQDFQFGKRLGELYLSSVDFDDRVGRHFPLYVALNLYASGDTSEARRVATISTQRMNASEWPYPIAMYQAEQINWAELIRMTGTRNANEMAAHCQIAVKESATGDFEQALVSMGLVLKSRNNRYVEHTMIDALADLLAQRAERNRRGQEKGTSPTMSESRDTSGTSPGSLVNADTEPEGPEVTYEKVSPEFAYGDAEQAFDREDWKEAAAAYVKALELIGDRTPDKIRMRISECALLSGNRELAEKLVSLSQPRAQYEDLYYPIHLFALATMMGTPEKAQPFLEDALRKANSDYWPYALVECCLGRRDFSDFLKKSDEYSNRHDSLFLAHGFHLLSKGDWRGGLASLYEGTDQLGEPQGRGYSENALHAAALRVFDQVLRQKSATGELKLPSRDAIAASIRRIRFYRYDQFPKLIITRLRLEKVEYCGANQIAVQAKLEWENSERYQSGRPIGWGSEEFRYLFKFDGLGRIIDGKID